MAQVLPLLAGLLLLLIVLVLIKAGPLLVPFMASTGWPWASWR